MPERVEQAKAVLADAIAREMYSGTDECYAIARKVTEDIHRLIEAVVLDGIHLDSSPNS
jgi:hypothetical protein